jgi:sulfite dehydrogenase (quinone) subunit SoeA
MHMVIRNAVEGDPYEIDTLMLFMANMAWNSAMNTAQTQDMLRARHLEGERKGEYKIPYLVVSDAFDSEMVQFADLVLPDTTYLERFDAISILDRPISEPDTVADAIRHPILKPDRDVRAWQEVLVDIAGRLDFPAFVKEESSNAADATGQATTIKTPKYSGYEQFITEYQKAPGIGFLAGFRGADGKSSLKGEPNPNQWQAYIDNKSFFSWHWPESQQWNRGINQPYLEASAAAGFIPKAEPIIMQIYSEPLQKFRLAGQGLYDGVQPPLKVDQERLTQYFDPLPDWYAHLDDANIKAEEYPFHAITQRPMMMYHSWDSQNAWLRQILGQNFLYMQAQRAVEMGLSDMDWVWVSSPNGRIRCQLKTMEGVERNTVWSWNAIGKMAKAWGLEKEAKEATHGFLLNHLISETLAAPVDGRRITNSDPITGQAAWYDLRVSITKAAPGETGVWPKLEFGDAQEPRS